MATAYYYDSKGSLVSKTTRKGSAPIARDALWSVCLLGRKEAARAYDNVTGGSKWERSGNASLATVHEEAGKEVKRKRKKGKAS